jgi:hypothetical protein
MNSVAKPEDLKWLHEVKDGQLLGRGALPIRAAAKRRLLELGWVEEKLGGLQITPAGRKAMGK